jgi:flavodoxin
MLANDKSEYASAQIKAALSAKLAFNSMVPLMPKQLVAYYSWTGNTAKVAKLLAETLSADIEEIHEVKPRSGLLSFVVTVVESVLKRSSPILKSTKNVADYDVVILGCPIWASNMATPMRTYILREYPQIKQVALFCTLGGSGGKLALDRMAALSGRTSLADLIVEQPALASGKWRELTENFARQVQKIEAESPAVVSA